MQFRNFLCVQRKNSTPQNTRRFGQRLVATRNTIRLSPIIGHENLEIHLEIYQMIGNFLGMLNKIPMRTKKGPLPIQAGKFRKPKEVIIYFISFFGGWRGFQKDTSDNKKNRVFTCTWPKKWTLGCTKLEKVQKEIWKNTLEKNSSRR